MVHFLHAKCTILYFSFILQMQSVLDVFFIGFTINTLLQYQSQTVMLTILGRPANSRPRCSSTSLTRLISLTTSVKCGPAYRPNRGPYLCDSCVRSRWGGRDERRCSRLPNTGTRGRHGTERRPSMHLTSSNNSRAPQQHTLTEHMMLFINLQTHALRAHITARRISLGLGLEVTETLRCLTNDGADVMTAS